MKYFIGDTHFATPGLIRGIGRVYPGTARLFESVEAHDDYLIDKINYTVGRHDELIVVGDFAKEKPGRYRQRIKCKRVYLVLGNHDSRAQCERVFSRVVDTLVVKLLRKLKCVVTHAPHAYWNGSHKGWGHVYGHVHGQREETLNAAFPGRRAFDVSVENLQRFFGYAPVSESFLYHYFIALPGHDQVSYYNALKEKRDKRLGLT